MKPLHRSLSFWLGVPGLVFLVWLWVDSFPRVSYVEYEGSEGWLTLRSDKGVFYYTLRDLKGGGEFEVKISQPRRFPVAMADYLRSSDLFPRPFDIKEDWNPDTRELWSIQVAQWVVSAIYLLAWVALLLIRRYWWKSAKPLAGGDGTRA